MSGGNAPKPTVSVAMVVHEPHPLFFPKAVGSILDQSWDDFELIIVEDPSPRRGQDMLRGCSDPRMRYVLNERRTSLVEQKNEALSAARGRYIALMDADDMAHATRLEKQIEYLDARPEISVLGSQIDVVDANDRVVGYRRFPLDHANIRRSLPRVVPLSQPSVMFRREVFDRFGAYQPTRFNAAEDYDLWSRWIKRGVRFANHPRSLLSYRLHSGQTKFARLHETILADLQVKRLHWADHRDVRARAWWLAQRLLLWLPESVVAKLLVWSLYRDRPMPGDETSATVRACLPAPAPTKRPFAASRRDWR